MLILVAHGSQTTRWRGSVESLVEELQSELGSDRVRLAFMELSPPSLAEVVQDAREKGIKKIGVLPLFLAASGHYERDIKPEVERLSRLNTEVEIRLLPPVGQHPRFKDLLRHIITEVS